MRTFKAFPATPWPTWLGPRWSDDSCGNDAAARASLVLPSGKLITLWCDRPEVMEREDSWSDRFCLEIADSAQAAEECESTTLWTAEGESRAKHQTRVTLELVDFLNDETFTPAQVGVKETK